jgi:RNA polymerase sigma factor (sigma-70 family)
MAPNDDDGELIARSCSEPRAFVPVFERHFDAVYGYVRSLTGAEAAADLAAETFLEAFAARRRYDASRPDARPWLLGIATNLVRRHRRRSARWRRAPAPPPVVEPEEEAVIARLDAGAARGELAAALSGLDAGQREVLLLYAWGDLSYEQIAEALALPPGTVRSRLSRARARLRELLPAQGEYDYGDHVRDRTAR